MVDLDAEMEQDVEGGKVEEGKAQAEEPLSKNVTLSGLQIYDDAAGQSFTQLESRRYETRYAGVGVKRGWSMRARARLHFSHSVGTSGKSPPF